MDITVYEFLDLLLDECEVQLFDFAKSDNIFTGESDELKDSDYGKYTVNSFELYEGKLIINIDTSEE